MATHNINIDSQLVVQTAAAWASDATVYSNKRMLLTSDVFYTGTDQPRFKFGDGVQTWANLDYVPEGGGSDNIAISYSNTQNSALSDSTTYYLSQMGLLSAALTSFARVPVPTGTLVAVYVTTWTTNTIGTEGATLTLKTNDGAESYEVSTDIKYNARNTYVAFTGLSETVTAGNSWFEIETPVYATNPGNSQTRVTIIIEL